MAFLQLKIWLLLSELYFFDRLVSYYIFRLRRQPEDLNIRERSIGAEFLSASKRLVFSRVCCIGPNTATNISFFYPLMYGGGLETDFLPPIGRGGGCSDSRAMVCPREKGKPWC